MAILERPFYFVVVLWGERFRNYFLDYCLASLLAPGNIPSLSTRQQSKFLIATVREDWEVMKATAIFKLLEQYIAPVFIEIPPCPPGKSACLHASVGHRAACDMAYRDKAYMTLMSPECLFSDAMVAQLQQLALNGMQMVLAGSIRFGEEPFLGYLAKIGALHKAKPSGSGQPLRLTSRQLVLAALNGFHSETSTYEWGKVNLMRGMTPIIPAAMWRVPGEDGIVLHSLSYLALLLDYAAVTYHDTSTFEDWTVDGNYYHDNAGRMERIHVVQDSDEMFVASWAPLADKPFPFEPTPTFNLPYLKRIFGWQFAQSFYSGVFDATKQRLLFKPLRWHSRPLNRKWDAVENKAQRELLTYLMPNDRKISVRIRLRRVFSYPAMIIWRTTFPSYATGTIAKVRRLTQLLYLAITGDRKAIYQVIEKIPYGTYLLGRSR